MAGQDNKWSIIIRAPFGGFSPAWWSDTYPSFGNRNQLGDMQNLDITNPTSMTQGPALANLTNGTQAAAVTTLIKHILEIAVSADVTYGIGGNKLYQIAAASVANAGNFPHTIDKAAVTGEDGESVALYGGVLYYLYNHSGSAGDIGKYDLASTFDDDWGSTVPTGLSALQNAPHPSVVGHDDVLYFGNGRYVGYYDKLTDTLSVDEFDVPQGSQVVDVRYHNSRVWIAANYPNVAGSNKNYGIIYCWAGLGVGTWDDFPNPRIQGRIGAIYPKDGTVFVWYQDLTVSGGYKLGYVRGNEVVELATYTGALPNFGQVGEYKNMLTWVSSGLIYVFGAVQKSMNVALSQLADAGYATVGALASPFGTPMVASNDGGSNYRLAQFSGYDTACFAKTLMFEPELPSVIDKVSVSFDPLATGARCDFVLRYNRGASAYTLGDVRFSVEGTRLRKTFTPRVEVDDFRIESDWTNGSATNPLKIRKIVVYGHYLIKE